MFRPASRPAGGRAPASRWSQRGEASSRRAGAAFPGAAQEIRGIKGRRAARRPSWVSLLPQGGVACSSRLLAAGAPVMRPGEGAVSARDLLPCHLSAGL